MDTALFDFTLPESAIAQTPADRRDASRLLLVDRATGRIGHHVFSDLPGLLPQGTRVFRNKAAVLRARIHARRDTGGAVECLLLQPAGSPGRWTCMVRPGRKLGAGAEFGLPGEFRARVHAVLESGERIVDFVETRGRSVPELALALGLMPLPPYIRRAPGDPRAALDAERYQTVYADASRPVAAAAPTAGLHFTPEVIGACEARGMAFHDLLLHVGMGTFKPMQTETTEAHVMHSETYEIPGETCDAILDPAAGPRLAVGTTSLRAMEDFWRKTRAGDAVRKAGGPWLSEASLFICPPDTVGAADCLLTNFHLPRSTLLCLVSAFLAPGRTDGIAWLKDIYADALARGYRFYSYGDAMLVL